jgi:prepilin peptidase CpaA
LPAVSNAAFVVIAIGMTVASVVDLRSRRIPNELTATLAGIGVGLAASGVSGVSLWASMLGFGIGLALMMPGHVLGATGAGDVRLMAAFGAIVGPNLVITAFLFTAIAGGLLALIVAIRRRRLSATLAGTGRLVAGSADTRELLRAAPAASRFAYGPAIAAGTIVAALVG